MKRLAAYVAECPTRIRSAISIDALRRRGSFRLPAAVFSALILLFTAASLHAADLIPIPEFTNHQVPQDQTPLRGPLRPEWSAYADLGYFVVALSLASYLAVKGRSRRGLFLLAAVSLAWLGFWRKGCVCPIGAIQNVSQSVFDPSVAVPWLVVAIFVLPLVLTLFFGRTFCASVCPLGAIQEMVAVRPVQVPRWLDHCLGLLAYIYLGAAVLFAATGSGWIICRYDPFVGLFRLSSSTGMLMLSAVFILVGLFVGRPYCRWLCPYGAILALLSRLTSRHLTVAAEKCIQCRLCEEACPYGAIVRPTITPSSEESTLGRRRLALALGMLPVIVLAGASLGWMLGKQLARMNPVISLAERVDAEDAGEVEGMTDASEAFRAGGKPIAELNDQAALISRHFNLGGLAFGAWVGLVFGSKLLQLSVRRRRTDYEPDRAACVSCGRCFRYCPDERTTFDLVQLEIT
jgi:polyferredoxin